MSLKSKAVLSNWQEAFLQDMTKKLRINALLVPLFNTCLSIFLYCFAELAEKEIIMTICGR